MIASRPLTQLEVTESFKFTSFTVTQKKFIMRVEKIIRFEITNSSFPSFTVELMPVKAVGHTSKFQSLRYLGLNNSTCTQKRSKISEGIKA